MKNHNTWLEIDEKSLNNNINIFKEIISDKTKICAVIKANAYGHGIKQIFDSIDKNNINWWAVNCIDEALIIRKLDKKRPILVLTDIPHSRYQELVDNKISLIISNYKSVEVANKLNGKLRVHIKIDTGLGRLGVEPQNFKNFLCDVSEIKNIQLEGIMSHFADAEDVLEQDYSLKQIDIFEKACKTVKEILPQDKFEKIIFHFAASAATILLPQSHYDMVRIGISMYGFWPSQQTKLSAFKKYNKVFDFQPVLSWYAKVINIKNLNKGQAVGYGCTYKLKRDSVIAIIPVGYFEGYNRLLSNKGEVLISECRCPVIGRVSMHMIIIDVTDCDFEVQIDDIVTLFGQNGGEQIWVEELANAIQTINYEFVTKLDKNIFRKKKELLG